MMLRRPWLAILVFLHPRSRAAVYKNPFCFFSNVLARLANTWLKMTNFFQPTSRNVTCNICGWSGRKYGYSSAISVNSFGSDDICLGCSSNARTRTLLALLEDHTDLTPSAVVIGDIGGSEPTRRFFRRHPNVRYILMDRYKNFAHARSDIINIALLDGSLDSILCCHVLEHVKDYRQALKEVYRSLKPGCSGIIAVPQTRGLEVSRKILEEDFLGYGHIWEFGDDFACELSNVGFEVSTVFGDEGDPHRTGPFHIVHKK